jgi:hypothetical protein
MLTWLQILFPWICFGYLCINVDMYLFIWYSSMLIFICLSDISRYW